MWRRGTSRVLQTGLYRRCADSRAVRAMQQNQASNKPYVISVEGNIGSGKSTFLRYLEPYRDVEVVFEPLHKWTSVGGHNALELLYQDSARWSFLFNAYAQLTRVDMHNKVTEKPVKVLERSIYSTRHCFVESAYRSGTLHPVEYTVLSQWFDWLISNKDLHLDLIVYLRADPEKCYRRLKLRDRREEATVPLSYLESLHALHEEWLVERKHSVSIPTMVIDANCSLEEFRQQYEYKLDHILGDFIGTRASAGTPV